MIHKMKQKEKKRKKSTNEKRWEKKRRRKRENREKREMDDEESKRRYKKSPEYNKILDKDDAFFVHLSAGLTLIRVNSASRRITMIYGVKKYICIQYKKSKKSVWRNETLGAF